MKCISCGVINTLRDRTKYLGNCKNCGHPFVFEPTAIADDIQVTDELFADAIDEISADDTLYFTPKQLFYFLTKRLRYRLTTGNSIASLVGIFIVILYWAAGASILLFGSVLEKYGWIDKSLIVIILPALFLLVGGSLHLTTSWLNSKLQPKHRKRLVITQAIVDEWLTRWSQVNSRPEKLLLPALPASIPNNINPEITNYSFDCLLVCDGDAIAQMLIANNFHFEHNCAILTISGYPQSIFSTIMQMVRRNPDLKVYALHDCTPQSIQLAHQLRTDSNWFAGSNIAILDIGLLPRQLIKVKRKISIEKSQESAQLAENIPLEIQESLSASELEWLKEGNFVELESLTPRTLIQILNRSMAANLEANVEDESLILSEDSSSYIYAIDSFG